LGTTRAFAVNVVRLLGVSVTFSGPCAAAGMA
jgi:hypothetical protein